MTEQRKIVLITGASSGIGRACAEYLAGRGYTVYGTSRRTQTVDTVTSGAAAYTLLPMDVTNSDSVEEAISLVMSREGRLDVVVNNAGIGISGPVEETTLGEAKDLVETNFFGMVRVCRAALPVLRAQGGGTIVNISSIGGRIAQPFQAFYCASKFAVEGYSEALRVEVAPFGIHVAMIEPGDMHTGFTASRRYAEEHADGSPYAKRFKTMMRAVESDELKGADPNMVGPVLYRIINSRSPRLHYPVGSLFQRIAAVAKSALPARVFEWALRLVYRV